MCPTVFSIVVAAAPRSPNGVSSVLMVWSNTEYLGNDHSNGMIDDVLKLATTAASLLESGAMPKPASLTSKAW